MGYPQVLPTNVLQKRSCSSTIYFAMRRTTLNHMRHCNTRRVLLNFFVNHTPSIRPIRSVILYTILSVTRLGRINTRQIILTMVNRTLFSNNTPTIFRQVTYPRPRPMPVRHRPHFVSLLIYRALPSFFRPRNTPTPHNNSTLRGDGNPTHAYSNPTLH